MKSKFKLEWISIFLLLGPFLDVASFLELGGTLSISMILRTLFLTVLCFLLIRKKNCLKELGITICIGGVLFCYSMFFLKQGMMSSLSSILKLIYLPICLLYFKRYTWKDNKLKILEIVLFTYLSIFLFSYLFNIGADAYLETDGKSGFKGLFSSINEFSAIIVSLLFLVGTNLKKQRKYTKIGILLLLSFCVSLLIGTKVLLGGILFTIGYFLFEERKRLFFDQSLKSKWMIGIACLIIVIGGTFLFTQTRTYKNMKVQQEFFQANRILSYNFVNRVVFNDRLTFLSENLEYFKKQPLTKQLFGIGNLDQNVKMVEIDLFDLLFRYGIVGFAFFFATFIIFIPWKNLKREELIAILLLLLISCTSGHVLFYPAVCIYFSCFIANSNTNRKCKQ